jgi:hypothetical protein
VAERAEVQYKYRSKTEDSVLYFLQCVEIHEAYTTVQGMREFKHPYDTNKCESMNKFVTKFVPKDSNFSGTRNWEGRVMYAVGVDSIGYHGYHHQVYSALGLEVRMCFDFTTVYRAFFPNYIDFRKNCLPVCPQVVPP